jgi:hypothetical protein
MSTPPENELDLDKLFLPAWAQEPASANLYAKYEGGGEDRGGRTEDRRGPRPPRRPGPSQGPPRDQNRPRGENRGPRPAGAGPPAAGRGERGRPSGGDRPGFRRGGPDRDRRPPPPPPLPEIGLSLVPDEKGVDSLTRQIKMTGRAYPLFGIAQMILQRPERVTVSFSIKKNAEGKAIQPLFACALDDTLWLSEDEAVAHILHKHFATFYQAERTATEPPKGKYTFVAQCGMSGIILGPPNYHDYQNQLRKLHTERFSRMPFEMYKARVKIVRDEETVKKWVEDQSWKTEYVCLNLPEALRLPTMEAVEKHFRETHKENIIKSVESHTMTGVAARSLRSPELARAVRSIWEDQRRFPLQIATVLSQQFASRGLQFFKVNRTITHVSVARPHYLDFEATPVSEGVKRIVDFINATAKCTRRQLVEALAPSPAPMPIPVAPDQAPAAVPAASNEPTPEQTAVVSDLHWLIHQGHVIEFANGSLETAKKPLVKPPRPPAKPPQPSGESSTQTEAAPAGEGVVPEVEDDESLPTASENMPEANAEPSESPVESAPEATAQPLESLVEPEKTAPPGSNEGPVEPAPAPVESRP